MFTCAALLACVIAVGTAAAVELGLSATPLPILSSPAPTSDPVGAATSAASSAGPNLGEAQSDGGATSAPTVAASTTTPDVAASTDTSGPSTAASDAPSSDQPSYAGGFVSKTYSTGSGSVGKSGSAAAGSAGGAAGDAAASIEDALAKAAASESANASSDGSAAGPTAAPSLAPGAGTVFAVLAFAAAMAGVAFLRRHA